MQVKGIALMVTAIMFLGMILPSCATKEVREIEVTTLENGLTVVTKELHSSPVVAMTMAVRTGALYEDDASNGASHFLEHLLFQKSYTREKPVFDYVDDIGGMCNAGTSYDFVVYYIEAPQEKFDAALDIILDMFLNPSLDEEEFDKEKGVILAEISAMESNPISALYSEFPSLLYEVHPYRRPVAGPPQTVEKMTLADLATFFYTHYTANRMTLALVGDFETSKILPQVKQKCSALRQGEPQEVKFPEQRPIESPRGKIETKGFPLAFIMIGWHGVKALDADFYPLQVLGYMLSGGKSSRLDQRIIESGLASEIYLISEPSYEPGAICFLVALSPENIDKVKQIIFAEIADIKVGNITEEELRRAKSLYKSDFQRADEKAVDIALHLGLFATIADFDFYNNLLGNVDKVTAEEVQRVCQKYLGRDNYAVLIFTPEVR